MIDERDETTPDAMDAGRSRRRWIALGTAPVLVAIVLVAFLSRPWGERSSTDQPGAASTMEGMDMSADRSVRLTADQIREFGVTFGSVEERRL